MENNKLGQEPAYPIVETKNCESIELGMSKRFYAACAAMQGLLYLKHNENRILINSIVSTSYEIADELLKQENNGK